MQQLLAQLQQMAQEAVNALQKGEKNTAAALFNNVAYIAGQISDECKV